MFFTNSNKMLLIFPIQIKNPVLIQQNNTGRILCCVNTMITSLNLQKRSFNVYVKPNSRIRVTSLQHESGRIFLSISYFIDSKPRVAIRFSHNNSLTDTCPLVGRFLQWPSSVQVAYMVSEIYHNNHRFIRLLEKTSGGLLVHHPIHSHSWNNFMQVC